MAITGTAKRMAKVDLCLKIALRRTCFHQLAQDVGPPSKRPVAFEGVPEGEGRGEVTEEEV